MTKMLQVKAVLLSGVILLCALTSGYAAMESERNEDPDAYERVPIYVDGVLEFTGYLMDDTAYVPLRSFCTALNMGAVVRYHSLTDTMTVSMERGGVSHQLSARSGDFYLYINERIVYLGADVLSHNGNVMVPLEGLNRAFGITAARDEAVGGLNLCTEMLQICASGSEVYDSEELKWLSHIINAEAGNQSMEGQICVGNVVLNRVAHENFPDTVKDVIFSPNQFCPVKSGSIYCTPDEDAIAAAKLCLEGVNLAGESTYFVNPVTGSTRWFRENLTYAMSVGDHDFYF